MFVGMWMTKDVITVPLDMPILEARDVMKENLVRRLPVLKNGKLVGIVTQGDIQEAGPSDATSLSIWELNYLLARMTVKEIMTKDVITVSPETPIEEAALIMRRKKIGGLPVIEDDKLVGIITESDIFGVLIEAMGIEKGGLRLTLELKNKPEALSEFLDVIRQQGIRLISLVTWEWCKNSPHHNVVVARIDRGDCEAIVEELRKRGIRLLDVRVGGTGGLTQIRPKADSSHCANAGFALS